MTARVISFKEEIVEEICRVAPVLLRAESFEALEQLLPRAKSFVRPILDNDVSASKKLLKLCLLRTLLPNKGEACEDAKQIVHRMLDGAAKGDMQRLFDGLEEPEIRGLTSELQYPLLHRLRNEMKTSGDVWRLCIDQELVGRLATLSHHGCSWSFHRLWQLLLENCKAETWQQVTRRDDWVRAAGIVLATCADKVTHLEDLDSEVLGHAYKFLDNRQCAIDFAWYFFKYDFWIMNQPVWPPASAARIFMEVASRDIADEGKLQLLFRAHNMRDSDALVRKALLEQLHCRMLESDTAAVAATAQNADSRGTDGADSSDPNIDVEELFLKLISEDGSQIPADVASKLSGKDAHSWDSSD